MKGAKSTIHQNLSDTAKVVLTGKFMVISAYVKKLEKNQVKKLTVLLKELQNGQNKHKINRKKIKIKRNQPNRN